jgi:hypothetical protein
MRRLLYYPAVFLVLICLEAILFLGQSFNFNNYGIVAWIAQTCAVLFAIGIAEEWYQGEQPSK